MSELPLEITEIELEGQRQVLKSLLRRYQFLKGQAAAQGMRSDPAILIEIEDLEKEIEKAKADLLSLDAAQQRRLESDVTLYEETLKTKGLREEISEPGVAITGNLERLDEIEEQVKEARKYLSEDDREKYLSHLELARSKISGLITSDPGYLAGRDKRWAVLVGVNAYDDLDYYRRLQVCVQDAQAIREQLVVGGFDPRHVHLLNDDTPELPTREQVLDTLKFVADLTEPDDLLLFYYSGHGDQDNGESYLVARNSRWRVLGDTAIRISRIKEILKEAPARAKVMILDACHSGANIGGKGAKAMSAGFFRRVFEQAEGLAILSSCKQDEKSWECPERGRSVFTHFLLEALAGQADLTQKGFVTVQDANQYVADGVKLWALENKKTQTPTLQYTVAGEIMLCRYRQAASA